MIAEYDFSQKLNTSKNRAALDHDALAYVFPHASDIRDGTLAEDRRGGDYIVTIAGREYRVDVKAREKGCGRYWGVDREGRRVPEVAVELVSVEGQRVGWGRDWGKSTDLYMFTFDPDDWPLCYVIPALDMWMFVSRYENVLRENFKVSVQSSGGWRSSCVFVPLPMLRDGITAAWRSRYSSEYPDTHYAGRGKPSGRLLFAGKPVGN